MPPSRCLPSQSRLSGNKDIDGYCDDDHNDHHNDHDDDSLPWLANAQEGEIGSDEREAQTPGDRQR